jgi:hypothetical protein
MPAPFYNAIKGTTSGTPGTGAFTPNAAAASFRPWSGVATGWIGLVRYEDGTAWELSWSYWNGTTLSRGTNQRFDSSTGSALSLTSAATAAMVADARELSPLMGGNTVRYAIAIAGGSTCSTLGIGAITTTGTGAAATMATTNYLTEQTRIQVTSATTANAQSGQTTTSVNAIVSTTAGHGGWEFQSRFGCSQLPTGPRLFVGMTATTYVASTAEPSALTANVAVFAKDSTDTNIQLLVNSNAGSGTKTDTGIPLTANGWYKTFIWNEAGTNTICGLLIRLDTGDIWFGSTSTDVPANGALMIPQVLAGLNGTNTGTAVILHFGGMMVRSGL